MSSDAPAFLRSPTTLLSSIDVFVFDCDGVLWLGDECLIPRAAETLARLRQLGKSVFFVTNNSTKSRSEIKKKFDRLGLADVRPEEILSSAFAAALYLSTHPSFSSSSSSSSSPSRAAAYVVGEEGICTELSLVGIRALGGPADAGKVATPSSPVVVDDESFDIAAVVVGFDRNINLYKLQYAQLCLNREDKPCEFIATNCDAQFHFSETQLWCGAGTMVGAIKGCTGREPKIVGKPGPILIEHIIEKTKVDRSRICMVGDRIDTDIVFGKSFGLTTVLVLSGVTNREKLSRCAVDQMPDFYADSIADLFPDSKSL